MHRELGQERERQRVGPRLFHLLQGDALGIRHAPTGTVGSIFRDGEIEAVWVIKQDESIDPR